MSDSFSHRLEVRFRDCDPMGHVNNAAYFTYLEQARFAYFRHRLGERHRNRFSFILARAECDFKAPAETADHLDVRVRISAIGRSSVTFEYEIVREDNGRLIASARTVLVAYDYAAAKPVPIPPEVRVLIEADAGVTPER